MNSQWTDEQGLQAVEARFGVRAAKHICVHGPIVLAHMVSMAEPFRSVNIVRLMRQIEYPGFTEKECYHVVMQVIRYINYSDLDYYIQQRRVRKTYMWFLFSPGSGKSQFRDQDEAFAARSRVYVNRPYHAGETAQPLPIRTQPGFIPQSTPTRSRPAPKHVIAQRVAEMTPKHLSILKKAFFKYFDGMKMPMDAITPDRMTQIYYSPGFAQFMTVDDRDDMTEFNEEQMLESFSLVSDMLAADERGLVARPGESLDL